MRLILATTLFATLAACGVDGPPRAPAQSGTGVTLSGDVRLGVAGEL